MAKTLKTDKYYVRYLTEDELEIARKALELPAEYPVRLLKAAIRKALREEVSLVRLLGRITSKQASAMGSSRWAQATSEDRQKLREYGKLGGRPQKLLPCPKCGQSYGVVALRVHKPRCGGRGN